MNQADEKLDEDIVVDDPRVARIVKHVTQITDNLPHEVVDEVLIQLVTHRMMGWTPKHRRQWQRATRHICDAFRQNNDAPQSPPPEARAA
jgi:hypothetical protein